MGKNSPTVKSSQTERITRVGSVCSKTQQKEGYRESEIYKISKHSLHYSEKGFLRQEMDHGSIGAERLHKVPDIPNVNIERGPAATAKRFLDSSAGPPGWLLAPPGVPPKKTFSGFSLQRPTMAIPGNALWLKYCPTPLYQSHGSRGQSNGRGGHFRPHLLRRSLDRRADKRLMLSSHEQSTLNIGVIRLDNKRKQVPQTSSTDLRMARSSFRPSNPYSLSNGIKHGGPPCTLAISDSIKILHKTRAHAPPGSCQLGGSNQSNNSIDVVNNKSPIEKTQEDQIGYKTCTHQRHETQPGQMASYAKGPTTPRQSNSHHYYTNRRLTHRVGFPNRLSAFSRNLRQNNVVLHQHIGASYNMVRFVNGGVQRPSNPDSLRQLGSYSSNQTRLLTSIPLVNDCRTDLEESSNNELDIVCVPHTGSLQCASRPVEQERSLVNGMGPPKTCIQERIEDEPGATDRLVCDSPESSTSTVHIALPGRVGDSSGCDDSVMGEVEPPIPLSPVIHDFQGFTEAFELEVQNCYSGHTRDAVQTMVHDIISSQDTVHNDSGSSPTISSRQIGVSSYSYQTTRLEIIKAAYERQFPGCRQAVTLMSAPIRDVSINEYEKKWKAFMFFLRTNDIPFRDISLTYVINFLAFLFYHKNLSPKTVAQYRTALAKPLRLYFGIDLIVPAIADLLKSMCLQRPSIPVSAPSWSLNKVLTFLDELPTPLTPIMLLRKTAFLLMLSTGWRISELSACVRDPEFCYFTGDMILNIRPHPSFLAKNENPQKRWDVKEIKKLSLQDGSVSKLCPVATVHEYLQSTRPAAKGPLFLTPGSPTKGLTIYKLGGHICQLIRLADPVSKIRVHDVRKYASSYSLINAMLIGELVSAMNWSSPVTFFKFYFTQTEPMERPVSFPVT